MTKYAICIVEQMMQLVLTLFQGVMGGVNASPKYVEEVNIGRPDGTVTNVTKQGGIISIVCAC